MQKVIVGIALSAALLTPWAYPAAAQQNGLVIQNNGVDSSDSAAGADNVQISRAPGNASSNTGAGAANEIGTVEKDRSRNRKDRGARNNAEELAAPAEEPVAAPADGGYEAYSEDTGWVDPAAAPEAAPQDAAAAADQSNLPIQLPNTGAGQGSELPLIATMLAMLASLAGLVGVRRRLT